MYDASRRHERRWRLDFHSSPLLFIISWECENIGFSRRPMDGHTFLIFKKRQCDWSLYPFFVTSLWYRHHKKLHETTTLHSVQTIFRQLELLSHLSSITILSKLFLEAEKKYNVLRVDNKLSLIQGSSSGFL